MGFFKWLDKQMRASNEISRERAAEREEEFRIYQQKKIDEMNELRQRRFELEELAKGVRCCANCRWYGGSRCYNTENYGKDESEYIENANNSYASLPYFKSWSSARECCSNFEPADD